MASDLLGAIGSISGGGAGSGLATLDGLALRALQKYQEQQGEPRSADLPPASADSVSDDDAIVIIRAMVSAANADGCIDAEEQQRILIRLERSATSDKERGFVARELHSPAGVEEIAKLVRTPELAEQVYGASLLVITADKPAEKSYMRYLADRIGLDERATAAIHRQLGVAPPG